MFWKEKIEKEDFFFPKVCLNSNFAKLLFLKSFIGKLYEYLRISQRKNSYLLKKISSFHLRGLFS